MPNNRRGYHMMTDEQLTAHRALTTGLWANMERRAQVAVLFEAFWRDYKSEPLYARLYADLRAAYGHHAGEGE